MIRIDSIWLATEPMDMRAGTETALARVIAVFGAAKPHCAYLFANRRANRMKVLVHDGVIIGRGFNCPISTSDPSAHAEMVAIRAAAQAVDNYRLPGSTLYVTLEPCSMCAGLIVHSRVARVVYGALEPKAGIVQSQGQFFGQGFLNHRVMVEGGVLAQECGQILSDFFKARRAKA